MYIKDGKKFHNELYYQRWVAYNAELEKKALEEAEKEAAAKKALEKLTKDELIAKAEELGIEVSSSMTKAEIIEALEA